jgi:hypothetical protein
VAEVIGGEVEESVGAGGVGGAGVGPEVVAAGVAGEVVAVAFAAAEGDEDVISLAAHDAVGARTAVEAVVAGAAVDAVGSGLAVKHVAAAAAADLVVPFAAVDRDRDFHRGVGEDEVVAAPRLDHDPRDGWGAVDAEGTIARDPDGRAGLPDADDVGGLRPVHEERRRRQEPARFESLSMSGKTVHSVVHGLVAAPYGRSVAPGMV